MRHPDKAYEMLLNMEKEWRVPDVRDYQRMLNLFKWANHQAGRRRPASKHRPLLLLRLPPSTPAAVSAARCYG